MSGEVFRFVDNERRDAASDLSRAQEDALAKATGTGIIFGGMSAADDTEPSDQMKRISDADVPGWLKPFGKAFSERGMARRFGKSFAGAGAATYAGTRAIDYLTNEDKQYAPEAPRPEVSPQKVSPQEVSAQGVSPQGTQVSFRGGGQAQKFRPSSRPEPSSQPQVKAGEKTAAPGWLSGMKNFFRSGSKAGDDLPNFEDAVREFGRRQESGIEPPTNTMSPGETVDRVEGTYRDMRLDAAREKIDSDAGFQFREGLRNAGDALTPDLDFRRLAETAGGLGLAGGAGLAANYGYRSTQPDVQFNPEEQKRQQQVDAAARRLSHPAPAPMVSAPDQRGGGQPGAANRRGRGRQMQKQSSKGAEKVALGPGLLGDLGKGVSQSIKGLEAPAPSPDDLRRANAGRTLAPRSAPKGDAAYEPSPFAPEVSAPESVEDAFRLPSEVPSSSPAGTAPSRKGVPSGQSVEETGSGIPNAGGSSTSGSGTSGSSGSGESTSGESSATDEGIFSGIGEEISMGQAAAGAGGATALGAGAYGASEYLGEDSEPGPEKESQLGTGVDKTAKRSLEDLEERDGYVKYMGRWMKPDQPVESWRPGKKRAVLATKNEGGETKVKLVHYGSSDHSHNYSEDAKKNYLSRARGITDGDGNPTKDDPHSANHWSIKDLWPEEQDADESARFDLGDVMDTPPEKTADEKDKAAIGGGLLSAGIGGKMLDPRETLYHGTGPEAARQIKQEGFKTKKNVRNRVDDANRTFFARPWQKSLAQEHLNDNWAYEKSQAGEGSYDDLLEKAQKNPPDEGMLRVRLPVNEMDTIEAGHQNQFGTRSTVAVGEEVSPEYIKGSGSYSPPGLSEIGRYVRDTGKGKAGAALTGLGVGALAYGGMNEYQSAKKEASKTADVSFNSQDINLETIDAPLGAAAASSFVVPAVSEATKGVSRSSRPSEALIRGGAGALEGLGYPGRKLQGGIQTPRTPKSIPSAVDRLRDSYGLGKSDQYYKQLAREARKDHPDMEKMREMFGEGAELQGSARLGVNIPGGKSDVDLGIVSGSADETEKTINRIVQEYEGIYESPYNNMRPHQVASGKAGGREVDVSVSSQKGMEERSSRYDELDQSMDDVERGRIIDQKRRVKDSFFDSGTRYKRYKRELDSTLDIPQI
jgi:hypothetical protein